MILTFAMLYLDMALLSGRGEEKTARMLPAEGQGAFSLILATTLWSLYLYLVTELLSAVNGMKAGSVFAAWVVLLIVEAAAAAVIIRKKKYDIAAVKNIFLRKYSRKSLVLAGCFIVYAMIILYLASGTVPYNSDSMVYHLTRIFRWARNGSVSHYATSNWRAIASTPFAEFVGLHIYLLETNDCLLNLVQGFSFCGVIYMVYQIAGRIGCDQRARTISAVLFATLPIAFAESLTTQVDVFGALWLVFFVYVLLGIDNDKAILAKENGGIWTMLLLGLLLGFGYLTKPTLLPAAGIFTVWVLVRLAKKGMTIKEMLQRGAVTVIGMLVLIAPEILRNLQTFHAISYSGVGARQIVGTMNPAYIFVNFLKVVFTNLPSIYWPNVYWRFPSLVYKVGALLGVNVDDPSIAETGIAYTVSHAPDYGCDTAVNFVMAMLVIVFLFVYAVTFLLRKKKKLSFGYSSCAFLAFILLQFMVRWEPYLTRYMIGYMALLAPAMGMQLQKIEAEHRSGTYIRGIATGMILFVSLVEGVNMLDDARVSIVTDRSASHITQYFATGKDKVEDYTALQELLQKKAEQGSVTVGLDLMEGTLEYPLLKMIDASASEIQDVNVDNVSVKYEDTSYLPEYIIYTGELDADVLADGYECHGTAYKTFEKISDTCYLISE